MFGKRLKQLRLSRNLSLEALAAEMGGIITKQALSKYELGKAIPSPVVMSKLASALGVKAAYLFSEPPITIEFIAYRKASRLLKREGARIEGIVEQALEKRVHLQELIGQSDGSAVPIKKLPIKKIEDSEVAAERLRKLWELGSDPILNITATLENHFLSILEVESNEKFDGISAIAYDDDHHVKAAAIVTRCGIAGERQRLNLAHELGHIVLDTSENIDEEKAAFRFGAAFLAPAEKLLTEVGTKRAFLQTEELLLLKRQFGISLQALLYRLRDLDIITESYYRQWCKEINRRGWKKKEPLELPSENPEWLRRSILRVLGEGLITREYAETALGEPVILDRPLSVVERRAFMKLPLEKRRQLLAEQAEKMARHYAQDMERREFQGSDIIEY